MSDKNWHDKDLDGVASDLSPQEHATLDEARRDRAYHHLLPKASRRLQKKVLSGLADESYLSPPSDFSDDPRSVDIEIRIEPEAIRDRVLGSVLGLALGDAVGSTLEFRPRDTYPFVTRPVGGGPFQLEPGQWTDDTSMALALAESLVSCGGFDAQDFMQRLKAWYREGAYSVTGTCFDIGNTTRSAIESFIRTGQPVAGRTERMSAGNGSLVRCAPVAIRWWQSPNEARRVAVEQSRTTHAADEVLQACRLLVTHITDALRGASKEEALRPRVLDLSPPVRAINAGEYRSRRREDIASSGYVLHTLEAALWAVHSTESFEAAVLTAINLGDDSDSVGAVAGQLAGALYGAEAIPLEWLGVLAWRERLTDAALRLFGKKDSTSEA